MRVKWYAYLEKVYGLQKKFSVLTIIFTSAEVVFEILIPIVISNLIDFGVNAKNSAALVEHGTVLLLLAIMQLVTGFGSVHFSATACAMFGPNIRNDCYKNIQTFSFSDIDKFSTASIVTRLTTDVTNVKMLF